EAGDGGAPLDQITFRAARPRKIDQRRGGDPRDLLLAHAEDERVVVVGSRKPAAAGRLRPAGGKPEHTADEDGAPHASSSRGEAVLSRSVRVCGESSFSTNGSAKAEAIPSISPPPSSFLPVTRAYAWMIWLLSERRSSGKSTRSSIAAASADCAARTRS